MATKKFIGEPDNAPDALRFSYHCNDDRLDLEPYFSTPLAFANWGFPVIRAPENGNGVRVAFEAEDIPDVDRQVECKVNVDLEEKCIGVKVSGPLLAYEQYVLKQRAAGKSTKGFGSLLERAVRAAATLDGSLFLHANAVYDSRKKILYVLASETGGSGKTACVNELLKTHGCQLVSNALRVRYVGSKAEDAPKIIAYPQGKLTASGGREIIKFMRTFEVELINATRFDLGNIGYVEIKNEEGWPVGDQFKLFRVPGYQHKLNIVDEAQVSEIRVVFPKGVSSKIEEPVLHYVDSEKGKQNLVKSWFANMCFGEELLYDKFSLKGFDDSILSAVGNKGRDLIDKIIKITADDNKNTHFIELSGSPFFLAELSTRLIVAEKSKTAIKSLMPGYSPADLEDVLGSINSTVKLTDEEKAAVTDAKKRKTASLDAFKEGAAVPA